MKLLLVAASVAVGIGMDCAAEEARSTRIETRLYELRGTERRMLDRFEHFLDREQWDDALDLAARLLESESPSVVAVDAVENGRYVSLREYCHRRLSRLPPAVLAQYRSLNDAPAEAWYRQGVAQRNEQLLRRIVDELFCSSWGDDALFALGELALERGAYHEARTHWSRISPELSGPKWLAYPDTDLKLADVRARLALVSLREGDLQQAANEIESLRLLHGDARGWLAGREVVYAEQLAELLEQARSWPSRPAQTDWPTFAGSAARRNASKTSLQPPYEKLWSHSMGEAAEGPPATFPIVMDGLLIYQTASRLQALQLETGQPVFASQAVAFRSPRHQGGLSGQRWYTLTGSGRYVFGRTAAAFAGQHEAKLSSEAAGVWGVDLERDGALRFRKQTGEAGTSFAGAPIVVGTRLIVALCGNGRTARAGIACFDLATRELIWQRWICQTNAPDAGGANELATNLLASHSGAVSDVVYSCTNLGAVAAIRTDDGQPLWVVTYDRSSPPFANSGKHPYARWPSPCIVDRGLLLVCPTDSRELLAFEAATGSLRWRRPLSGGSGQLIGVVDGKLLIADEGFLALDSLSGKPLAANEDLQLFGQAVIVGKTLYWPTDRAIQRVDVTTGELAELALPLPESGGANLLAVGETLVAAGRSKITVFQALAKSP